MKTVLVVDNQALILEFMKRLIEARGHRALTASNGLEALEILDREHLDLAFVDLVMPKIDGAKLCGLIRGSARHRGTRIVVLSAIASEDSEKLHEVDADLYIAKGPLAQMAKHVEAVLDWPQDRPLPEGILLGAEELHPREITSELLHTKRHLELILERMSEGILEMTMDGRIVFANPAAVALLGAPEEDLLGKRASDILDQEQARCLEALLAEALLRKTAVKGSSPLLMADRRVHSEIFPIPGECGGAVAILGDVTEIHRTAELLSVIMDGNPIPTIVIDRGHRVILWNRAMELLTGVKREQVLGRIGDSSVLWGQEAMPFLVDLVLEMDEAGIRHWYGTMGVAPHPTWTEAFEGTARLNLGRQQRDVRLMAARLRDSRGELVGAIETLQDVTEQEELNRQLQHAQKMQAVGTLAAGMAHEFNNILAAIQGYAQLMHISAPQDHPDAEYLREILASCQRAAGLIRRVLSFSRVDQGERVPVKVNQVVEGVAQILRRTIPPKVAIRLALEPGLPFVLGEYTQLEQVLLNLGVNAWNAMPQGGEILMSTRLVDLTEDFRRGHPWAQEGQYVEVVVEDTGVGMTPEVLERAFEPFFTTKEPGKGTGLGLSIAYSIVKSHKGYILAESPGSSGTGSRITLFLPAMAETEQSGTSMGHDDRAMPRGSGDREADPDPGAC